MMALKVRKPTEDNAVYEFMIKKESEGKAKNVAKMPALNKFLRIYYTRVIWDSRWICVKYKSTYCLFCMISW